MNNTPISAVIINGMYRSGTSILWRILSEDPYFRNSLYEPLHPKLLSESKVNDAMRYFYDNPIKTRNWTADFNINNIRLENNSEYPKLKEYFSDLIQDYTLIKTTRMNLRLGWLLSNFNNILIINLIRDPRAICYSYLKRSNQLSYLESKCIQKFFQIQKRNLSYFLKRNTNLKKYTSIYWHEEYLSTLMENKHWKNYINKYFYSNPIIRLLAMYRINYEQSINDLKQFDKTRYINVKFEELIKNPTKKLTEIYNKIGRELPKSVKDNAFKNSGNLKNIRDHEYNKMLNPQITEKWKRIDNNTWIYYIRKAKLDELFLEFYYI